MGLEGRQKKGTPFGAVEDGVIGNDDLFLAHGAKVRSATDVVRFSKVTDDRPELQKAGGHFVFILLESLLFLF